MTRVDARAGSSRSTRRSRPSSSAGIRGRPAARSPASPRSDSFALPDQPGEVAISRSSGTRKASRTTPRSLDGAWPTDGSLPDGRYASRSRSAAGRRPRSGSRSATTSTSSAGSSGLVVPVEVVGTYRIDDPSAPLLVGRGPDARGRRDERSVRRPTDRSSRPEPTSSTAADSQPGPGDVARDAGRLGAGDARRRGGPACPGGGRSGARSRRATGGTPSVTITTDLPAILERTERSLLVSRTGRPAADHPARRPRRVRGPAERGTAGRAPAGRHGDAPLARRRAAPDRRAGGGGGRRSYGPRRGSSAPWLALGALRLFDTWRPARRHRAAARTRRSGRTPTSRPPRRGAPVPRRADPARVPVGPVAAPASRAAWRAGRPAASASASASTSRCSSSRRSGCSSSASTAAPLTRRSRARSGSTRCSIATPAIGLLAGAIVALRLVPLLAPAARARRHSVAAASSRRSAPASSRAAVALHAGGPAADRWRWRWACSPCRTRATWSASQRRPGALPGRAPTSGSNPGPARATPAALGARAEPTRRSPGVTASSCRSPARASRLSRPGPAALVATRCDDGRAGRGHAAPRPGRRRRWPSCSRRWPPPARRSRPSGCPASRARSASRPASRSATSSSRCSTASRQRRHTPVDPAAVAGWRGIAVSVVVRDARGVLHRFAAPDGDARSTGAGRDRAGRAARRRPAVGAASFAYPLDLVAVEISAQPAAGLRDARCDVAVTGGRVPGRTVPGSRSTLELAGLAGAPRRFFGQPHGPGRGAITGDDAHAPRPARRASGPPGASTSSGAALVADLRADGPRSRRPTRRSRSSPATRFLEATAARSATTCRVTIGGVRRGSS